MKLQRDLVYQMESKNITLNPAYFWCFAVLFLIVFLIRTFFTVDFYDEFYNTSIAYQTVLGQTFLSDTWNFYQTGNSIQIPFLWLYKAIAGSMEGVILAGRIYYFVCCCLIGFVAYSTFRQNRMLAGFSLVMIGCFAPFSLFYWWYDTAMIQFSLLGCLLIVRAFNSDTLKSERRNLFIAGVFHAWMVFSYPFTILIVMFFIVFLIIKKRSVKPALWYILGSLVILLLFLAYCASIGFENLFLLRQNQGGKTSGALLSGLSERSYLFSLKGYLSRLKGSIFAILKMDYSQLLGFAVSGILLTCAFRKRNWAFCLGILLFQPLLPFFLSLSKGEYSSLLYWSYFFEFGFVFWLILRQTDQKPIADKLFLLLWLPSILAFCAVTLTALGDSSAKGLLGLYCGAFAGFLLFLLLLQVILVRLQLNSARTLLAFCALMLIAGNIQLYILNPYRSASAADCDYIMQSGICKGIVTVHTDESYEQLEKDLNALVQKDDETILALDRAPYIYLMTNLKMASPLPDGWAEEYDYWSQVSGMPDLIVFKAKRLSEKTQTFQDILRANYEEIGIAGLFTVYHLKS